jgi:hypothetical protein
LNILDGTALQGDLGANCRATNLKEILWDYQTLSKPIPITTYNKDKTKTLDNFQAIGTGIIKVIDNNQDIMHFITLHTPLSTGTIISPDRYATDNQHCLKKWIQEGEPATGKDMMTYLDHQDTPVSQVNMRRSRDGLWYVNNPILIPNNKQDHSDYTNLIPDIHKASSPIISEDASVTSQDDDNTDQDSQCTTELALLFPSQWDKSATITSTTIVPPTVTAPDPTTA